jgi:hypothetical protein
MAVPLALLSMGVAHANSSDDDFVQRVNNIGITGAPADLIGNGHRVCQILNSGVGPDDIVDSLVNQLHFHAGRAAYFEAISVAHYCPQYGNVPFQRAHSD